MLAVATLGAAIRRKGLIGGTVNTVLDFIPYIGGAKNLAEVARGRDFIRDRRDSVARTRHDTKPDPSFTRDPENLPAAIVRRRGA